MKHLKFFFIFAVLLTIGTTAYGQNVTIKGDNGSTLASVPQGNNDYDVYFKAGGFATWKHQQLNMTMTASDERTLTANGQLSNPANNLFVDGTKMQVAKGGGSTANICYLSISLPKGYRFTGYSITFSKAQTSKSYTDSNGRTQTMNFCQSNTTTRFGETDDAFGYAETSNFNSNYITSATVTRGTSNTISRTAQAVDGSDMGNVLYFKLQNNTQNTNSSSNYPEYYRELITLESAEFTFTAESDYTPVIPVENVTNMSAVDIPFNTSSVDYGNIEGRTYDGSYRISYDSELVKDVMGNMTLFEKESVTAGTAYDGTSGNVVEYKAGTISSQGIYFKLGRSTGAEQIYFLETPISITQPSNTNIVNPVGYRIVGADFEASKGHGAGYIISYVRNHETYYLGRDGQESVEPAVWEIDGNYLHCGDNYLYTNSYRYLGVTTNRSEATTFSTYTTGGKTYLRRANTEYYLTYTTNGLTQTQGLGLPFQFINRYTSNTVCTLTSVAAESVGNFKLKIYDETGTTVKKTIDINDDNTNEFFFYGNYNNDAVKIGVEGVGLVRMSLTIQALDPYIDHMEIVCEEAQLNTTTNLYEPTGNGRKLTIPFSASDFAVSGGAFHFYIPTSFQLPCLFSFKELYSKYGDSTYYGESGSTNHARYSFVKSPYWNTNADLYASTYNPGANYQDKVNTSLKGTIQYQFNNAATVGTSGGQYREYPFTLARYTAAGGNFDQLYYTDTEMTTGASKTAYLFTCDETRYNISTATATQHRTYAFYKLDITAQKKNYDPKLAWEKIYNQTYYNDGGVREDAMYGLTVTTTQAGEGNSVYGYVTVAQINQAITNALGTTNAPAKKDQILYIDGSDLLSVVEVAENNVTYNYAKLKDGLAKNALVYLPKGTSTKIDNYAVFSNKVNNKKSFAGANNFIIYDKNPFYSKYDVQVDAANSTTYERLVTNGKNGKVTAASIILPFEIKVDDNGIHTNVDGTQAFSLHQLQATNCLSDEAPEGINVQTDVPYAFFPKVSNITKSEPNKPYVVKVLNPTDGNTSSFIVTQKGALIAATTGMASDYTITGGTASGKSKRGENNTQGVENTYNFTSKGTYAGITINKGAGVFYFAQNKFVCSNDLDDAHPTVKGQPFRAFYTTGNSKNLLPGFEIYFGEGNGTPTGITDVTNRIDTGIKGGKGTITISSAIDNNVKIYNTSGMHFMNVDMQAGETKTVNVPAGIYVVNGVKIIVK